MSTELDALHSLRNFARQLRPLFALEEKLKEYAGLENAIMEAKARLSELEGMGKTAQNVIAKAHRDADAEIGGKRQSLVEDINRAEMARQDLIDGGHKQAARIVSAARAEVAVCSQETDRQRVFAAEHRYAIDQLKSGITQHEQVRDKVLADIDAANVEHARVQAMIADLKAKF